MEKQDKGGGADEVAQVRGAVRSRVAQTSFRAVAGETGVSRSGLHGFVKGNYPQSRTWDKLKAWYDTQPPSHAAEPVPGARRSRWKPAAERAPSARESRRILRSGRPLGEMRILVQSFVERSSLRAVAADAGTSKGVIEGILAGRRPQERTWERLTEWQKRLGEAAAAAQREDVTYRQIPVPQLRAWVLAQLEHQTYRDLAADIGIHHSSLEAFVKRIRRPSMRMRRLIGRRYLAMNGATPRLPDQPEE